MAKESYRGLNHNLQYNSGDKDNDSPRRGWSDHSKISVELWLICLAFSTCASCKESDSPCQPCARSTTVNPFRDLGTGAGAVSLAGALACMNKSTSLALIVILGCLCLHYKFCLPKLACSLLPASMPCPLRTLARNQATLKQGSCSLKPVDDTARGGARQQISHICVRYYEAWSGLMDE